MRDNPPQQLSIYSELGLDGVLLIATIRRQLGDKAYDELLLSKPSKLLDLARRAVEYDRPFNLNEKADEIIYELKEDHEA